MLHCWSFWSLEW